MSMQAAAGGNALRRSPRARITARDDEHDDHMMGSMMGNDRRGNALSANDGDASHARARKAPLGRENILAHMRQPA